jgi:hypothetical protein
MGAAKEIKYFLIRRVLTLPVYYFLGLYAKTTRLTVGGDEKVLNHLKIGRILFASWHQRFFGGFYLPKIYGVEPCIMISQSRDGDFIASVVKKIGWRPVRGSTSRGGKQALLQMIKGIEEQNIGGHIVDGPGGPPRVVKPGLLSIAQKSDAVICPVYVTYENPWIFNSWDRFMIPKPFSRVHIQFGLLTPVERDLKEDEFKNLLQRIETEMIKGYEKADQFWT